jgi:hypothetical protein
MYTIMEKEIVEKYDLWEDEEFLNEINDRHCHIVRYGLWQAI